MQINYTQLTRTNDFLDNTENIAMVHVHRVVEAGDSLSPFIVKIEGLTTVKTIIFQVLTSAGVLVQNLPTAVISGNQISFSNKASYFTNANGNKFSIWAFGI